MAAKTGFRYVKSLSGHNTAAREHFIVKNSEVITKGDAVRITSGYLVPAGATTSAIGVADQTVTGATATGVTCEVIIDPTAVYEVYSDATCAQATMGTYFDLTGTTGAQYLDGDTTTTTGTFIGLTTDGATTNSKVTVMIAEKQLTL